MEFRNESHTVSDVQHVDHLAGKLLEILQQHRQITLSSCVHGRKKTKEEFQETITRGFKQHSEGQVAEVSIAVDQVVHRSHKAMYFGVVGSICDSALRVLDPVPYLWTMVIDVEQFIETSETACLRDGLLVALECKQN